MLVDVAAKLAALVRSIAHSLVIVSNDSLGNESSEVVGRIPAHTFDSESDVGSRHVVVTNTDIRTNEIGLLLRKLVGVGGRATGGKASEMLFGQLDQLFVGNATGTDKNHAVSSVVVLDIVDELGSGDIADVLARAKDGATQRLVLESSGVKVVENDLLDLLLNLLRLSKNNITLALNGRLLELRVLENIGQNIDTLRNVGVEGLGEIDGVFALRCY